jgi:hypothetical protein
MIPIDINIDKMKRPSNIDRIADNFLFPSGKFFHEIINIVGITIPRQIDDCGLDSDEPTKKNIVPPDNRLTVTSHHFKKSILDLLYFFMAFSINWNITDLGSTLLDDLFYGGNYQLVKIPNLSRPSTAYNIASVIDRIIDIFLFPSG